MFTRSIRAFVAAAAVLAGALASTHPAAAYTPKVLRIGFAPFENQEEVLRKAQPMVQALTEKLHMPVEPFVAGDYPGVVEAMRGGKLDVAFYSPAAFIMAEKVAHAKLILKSLFKGRSIYYSAIITRADAPIHSLKDLKGKTFAFVDPGSTSGCVYPKVMLKNAGLNPDKDFARVIYAGGHDAAVLAVLNHKVDAAATFAIDPKTGNVPWKKMLPAKEAAQIRVLEYSKPIPTGAIAVAHDLDPQIVEKVKRTFLEMGKGPNGRKELSKMYLVDGFAPATDADYAPVREAFEKVGLAIK